MPEEMRKLREKTALPGFASWPPEFREVSMGYMATNPEGLQRWLEIHYHSRQKGAPAQPQRTTITYEKLAGIRGADAFDARRSRPADTALGHAPPARSYPPAHNHRAARGRALDQLGAARGFQPQCVGVY